MMFQGDQPSKPKGKRTSGFQSQNQPNSFSLGWDVSNQMNDYQVKKQQKGQNMAYKVTSQIQVQETENITFEDKCKQFILNNPNITADELQEKMALWEANLNKPAQQQKTGYKPSDIRYEKVKPAESAKNIIYGEENQTSNNTKASRSSRRNEGTFSLGDGYNYFKDSGNK